jgi:hypothetical protein
MNRALLTKRDRLIFAVSELPDAQALKPGFYVDADDGEPDLGACFCHEHAEAIATWAGRERATPRDDYGGGYHVWVSSLQAQTDGAERCDFGNRSCNRPLSSNLTDHGVDCALALTEAEPLKAHIYPAELDLAARAMGDTDPRWATWEAQAERVLAKVPS